MAVIKMTLSESVQEIRENANSIFNGSYVGVLKYKEISKESEGPEISYVLQLNQHDYAIKMIGKMIDGNPVFEKFEKGMVSSRSVSSVITEFKTKEDVTALVPHTLTWEESLREIKKSCSQMYYEEYNGDLKYEQVKKKENDGDGGSIYLIISLTDHNNRLIKMSGDCTSYDGPEFYTFEEVKPVQKTIISYEKV